MTRDMKPERIEELARLAWIKQSPLKTDATLWERLLAENQREGYRRIARTLYAAAMRDAAGVANEYADKKLEVYADHGLVDRGHVAAARQIATALEAKAQEASNG
jgi:hypothetical protein